MMRCTALVLLLAAVALALTLTTAQGPFDSSSFSFQQYRDYAGTVFTRPTPTLTTAEGKFLLTRPGKFDAQVSAWSGRAVSLRGALIQSGGNRMLEIEPASVREASAALQMQPRAEHIATMELAGEIADSKCHLGVMNPGRGKVHRDCAVRCISGGVPPALLVRDATGTLHTLLLTGIGREILNYVAEPVRIRGELQRANGHLLLKAGPSSLRRE